MAREGARIVVSDLLPEVAEETAAFLASRGYAAVAVPGDASEQGDVQAVVQRGVEHFGHVDTMVNLAGRQFRWPVTDVNLHDWTRELNTFVTAGMLTTKHMARAMIEQGP